MQLAGNLTIALPPARVLAGLHNPQHLAALLPKPSSVIQLGIGEFDFTLIRDVGGLTLKLPGRLQIEPVERGKTYIFTARAQNILAGAADLALRLDFTAITGGTSLDYTGSLDAKGLARRLLGERQDKAQAALDQFFRRLKHRLERAPGLRPDRPR